MSEKERIVDFQEVGQKFSRHVVFRNLNFSFYEGEVICLFAPSGVGKTTLIKMMLGLIKATTGVIRVLGSVMPSSGIFQSVGYMGQEDALYDELTAAEHLRYFGAMYGLKRDSVSEKIGEVLDLLALSDDQNLRKKKVKDYSGGMRKRLSLAIALLHDPLLLILDEPTVGIDPALRKRFWDGVRTLKEKGKTLVISTHLMDEILQADRILMLGEKKILAFGSPQELARETGCHNMDEAYIYYHNKVLAP